MSDEMIVREGAQMTTAEELARAGDVLRAGGLVAFPTETVYGLGADATNDAAVRAIYEAKGRPSFNPLIVHVVSLEAAREIGVFGDAALKLAGAFWPGPLTLVVPLAEDAALCPRVTAGLSTVAIRVPSHPVAVSLLERAQTPIAAPSANRSGHVSATTAAHVRADLGGRVDMFLDGGETDVGLESTIVEAVGGRVAVLRPGSITRAQIEEVLGRELSETVAPAGSTPAITAPGQLASHYAPNAQLRLNVLAVEEGEALIGFGADAPAGVTVNLSVTGNLDEAAHRLFGVLRALDESWDRIAVMPIPDVGVGVAINDRLRRAAAPKDA